AEARAASILVEAESRLATERARAAQLEGSAADARCEKEAALAANELLGERLRAAAEAETGAVALARRKYDEEARGASLAEAVAHAVEAAVGHTQSVAFVDKCRTLDEVIEATREAAARESAAEAAVLRNELFAEAAARSAAEEEVRSLKRQLAERRASGSAGLLPAAEVEIVASMAAEAARKNGGEEGRSGDLSRRLDDLRATVAEQRACLERTMADRSAAAWDMMRLLSAATAVGGGGVSQEPSDARASCPVCNP
ncbi:hypothetical protein EMIHUDRAFT_238275, partial [Emiliania huxleyi CCMP1516]|uniref:RING-type E3 ubiquitin transferase n=2 Tax=Emiliania huxleyi TaxID=2903 RepID=A0A0D3JMP8_EMIH1